MRTSGEEMMTPMEPPTHWECQCKCRHALTDESCPLCGDRRTDVFRREVDAIIGDQQS